MPSPGPVRAARGQATETSSRAAELPRSGPAANDNAEVPLPPQPPVTAQPPVLQLDEITIVSQAANDNEKALALASGDRPRASLGGGSRIGSRKPATPPRPQETTAPSTPRRPPATTQAGSGGGGTRRPSSFTTEEVQEHVQAGGGHEIPVERHQQDPTEITNESELSKERGVQPAHLLEGTLEEGEQLLKRGLTQADKVPWDPGPENLRDPEFRNIVGQPEYTPRGQLVGCILDGPGLEIKSGSSPLEPTYQLRLMVYRSWLLGEPLEISTTRPIPREIRAWLTHYGVKITGFIK